MRNWLTVPFDRALAERLAAELALPLPVACVLAGRGLNDPNAAARFLAPRLSDLSDPFAIPGMSAAADRILKTVGTGERVTVYGDYDVDGITATALLAGVLRRLGVRASPFLPNRLEEGYGMSVDALTRCVQDQQPKLVVTVDCGTGACEAVEWARGQGIDVVVSDHHEPAGPRAAAVAVVNPKLGQDPSTMSLAGVGVAFKLCHALIKQSRTQAGSGRPDLDLRDWLDLVAVGTVADVVPLVGENRILVRHGLARLNSEPCVGLRALKEVARLNGVVSSYHIGFVMGPRLNAAGRLGSADVALELMLTTDPQRARELAGELDVANGERKRIEDGVLAEAMEAIGAGYDEQRDFGLVAGRDGWHVGTIGIVAARVCGRYRRPAVVVGFDGDGIGRGSCRSIESVDIMAVLRGCADLLVTYGGHKMAAGIEIERKHYDSFRRRFNERCAAIVKGQDLRPTHRVDAWLGLREADETLLSAIRQLEPMGLGNPAPTWGARRVRVIGQPRRMGRDGEHLRMTVGEGGAQMGAIAFKRGATELPQGDLDILFRVEENTYQGQRTLQLNVQDYRAAE